MAWHPERGLLDLYDGQGDLSRRCIRAVGEPRRRFEEDALRMLRAVRFACRLDFAMDTATAQALAACAPLLDQVARERVGIELAGILASGHGGDALLRYPELMCAAIPELAPMRGFDQHSRYHAYTVYEHTARVLTVAGELSGFRIDGGDPNTPPSPSLMWAALLHDVAKPATFTVDERGRGHFYGHPEAGAKVARTIMRRLSLPGELVDDACLLIRYHDRAIEPERESLLRMMHLLSAGAGGSHATCAQRMGELLDLKRADTLGKAAHCFYYVEEIERMREMVCELVACGEAYSVRTLAISGADLIAAGVRRGRRSVRCCNGALRVRSAVRCAMSARLFWPTSMWGSRRDSRCAAQPDSRCGGGALAARWPARASRRWPADHTPRATRCAVLHINQGIRSIFEPRPSPPKMSVTIRCIGNTMKGGCTMDSRALVTRRGLMGASAFALVGAAGLVGCSGKEAPTGSASDGTVTGAPEVTIAMSTSNEPAAGFDPCIDWGCGEHVHEPLIQSTLVVTNRDMEFENDLATSYECSADNLVWTFEIRDDVHFSDGEPLTAADVAFTINTIRQSPQAQADLTMVTDAVAVSDTVVEIHLSKPWNALLYTLAVMGIVPEHAYGEDYGANPIGSGRYLLKQWDKGQQAIFEANPSYYGEAPSIERFCVMFMEEDAALAAAKGGKVDMAYTSATFADQQVDGYELASYASVDSRGINLPVILQAPPACSRATLPTRRETT